MATRITITDEYGRKHEHFYKGTTVSKAISVVPRGMVTKECRLDVDITNGEDIQRVRDFLKNLAPTYKE